MSRAIRIAVDVHCGRNHTDGMHGGCGPTEHGADIQVGVLVVGGLLLLAVLWVAYRWWRGHLDRKLGPVDPHDLDEL